MTYDDLKLDDGQILDVFDVARQPWRDGDGPRRKRRLHRVADEDASKPLGRTAPRFHAHARPMLVEREATHRAIALSRAGGRAHPDRARVRQGSDRADPLGAGPGPHHLCRDLPAIPLPHGRGLGAGRQLPRRALHLQPAAARQGQPGTDLERLERRAVHGVLLGPRALQLRRPGRQEARRRRGAVPPHPQRHPGTGDAAAAAVFRRRAGRPHDASTASSNSRPPIRPRPTACTRARERSRSAATPTW